MNITRQANNLLSARDRRLSGDRRDFKLIYAATFVLFVVVFSLARLLPRNWISRSERKEHGKGIIEQARAEANILASCALMR